MGKLEFKKKQILLDDQVVTFIDEGPGEPLVFLHPLFTSWEVFKPILPSFAKDFRVIALDFPGFGDSREFPYRHTLANYAQFLIQFFSALDLKRVILCGVSLGGTVGFKFAAQYPDKVKKLIAQGAPVRGSDISIPKRDKVFLEAAKKSPLLEKLISELSQNRLFWLWVEEADPHLGEAIMKAGEGKIMEFFEKLSPRAVIELGEDLLAFDMTREVLDISVPVRLIMGTEDRVVSVDGIKKLNKMLPNSKLQLLKGEKHTVIVENPKALTSAIQKFILEE